MSIEGGVNKHSPESPEEERAHEEANILSSQFEGKEKPTADDYDKALVLLDELKEEADRESPSVDKISRPIRDFMAGSIEATSATLELLGLAINSFAPNFGIPKEWREKNRQELIERFKSIPENYRGHRQNFESARERLERWKKEAEEFAKSKTRKRNKITLARNTIPYLECGRR